MARVRGKFRCSAVEFLGDPASAATVRNFTFAAIYDTSTPENERFTKATPWGEVKMRVDNPEVKFTPGALYYLDFTEVEEVPPTP